MCNSPFIIDWISVDTHIIFTTFSFSQVKVISITNLVNYENRKRTEQTMFSRKRSQRQTITYNRLDRKAKIVLHVTY